MPNSIKYIVLTIVTLTVQVFLNQPVYSDLSSSLLSDLVNDSELIAVAKVKTFDVDNNGKGNAQLEVIEIIKGDADQKEIYLSWTDEVHDQKIIKEGTRLLFLKKSGLNEFKSTQYGRSYWPLVKSNDNCSYHSVYKYPTNMIKIDKPYINANILQSNSASKIDKIGNKFICINPIKKAIRQNIKQ